jgi:uncharacterized membrane protein YecN with MAPEG domain
MITALYAIPLALLFLILTARVITYRRDNQIGLGDDGDKSCWLNSSALRCGS